MSEVPLMNEAGGVTLNDGSHAVTAGYLLRSAREAAGLHIVAVAAALKVPVRKLEALEANRWEDLTDTIFVRALAGSVARHLKIDPAPILAALPIGKMAAIDVPENLGKAPNGGAAFKADTGVPWVVWFVPVLVIAAATLYWLPDAMLQPFRDFGAAQTNNPTAASERSGVLPGAETPRAQSSQVAAVEELKPVAPPPAPEKIDQVPSAQIGEVAASASTNVPQPFSAANPLLVISATADTWVEVVGQDGKLRMQRLLKQGESISFDDSPAFSVVLGNASGAQVLSKGVGFDLTPVVKNNIARFEVKRS